MTSSFTSPQKANRTLDMPGEICPYTFVKAKLALEEMEVGQVLEMFVYQNRSATMVPPSLEREGHRVLSFERVGPSKWRILVSKATT